MHKCVEVTLHLPMKLKVPIVVVDPLREIHILVREKPASWVAKISSQYRIMASAFFSIESNVGCLRGEPGSSPLKAAYFVLVR